MKYICIFAVSILANLKFINMKNLNEIQNDLNKLNDEYIVLLKDRIKELEAQNEILIEALKK